MQYHKTRKYNELEEEEHVKPEGINAMMQRKENMQYYEKLHAMTGRKENL